MTETESKLAFIGSSFEKALTTRPSVREYPGFTPTMDGYTHIRAVTYDGLPIGGQKTKVFAYVGFPDGAAPDTPVPGIVLIHGGGGHAFLEWVRMWNDCGYAAIAMDNTGFFPTEVNAGESEITKRFAWGLSGPFSEEGYVNAPACDAMGSSEGDPDRMWMYHAVGQTILAHNVLRADPRVDNTRTGLTGISWGGVIAALVLGYDTRFSFAVPVYGSGYLTEARSHMAPRFAPEATRALWSASRRFDRVVTPTLWLGWNDDNCFSINSHSASYRDTVRVNPLTRLSLKDKMYHSHGCGWAPAEIRAFADSVVMGAPRLPGFREQPSGRTIRVGLELDADVRVTGCTLFYITSPQTYSPHMKYGYTDSFMDQEWQTAPLAFDAASGVVSGAVPADAAAYYVEVKADVGGTEVVVSSEFIE